jgi:hypothetical protein
MFTNDEWGSRCNAWADRIATPFSTRGFDSSAQAEKRTFVHASAPGFRTCVIAQLRGERGRR